MQQLCALERQAEQAVAGITPTPSEKGVLRGLRIGMSEAEARAALIRAVAPYRAEVLQSEDELSLVVYEKPPDDTYITYPACLERSAKSIQRRNETLRYLRKPLYTAPPACADEGLSLTSLITAKLVDGRVTYFRFEQNYLMGEIGYGLSAAKIDVAGFAELLGQRLGRPLKGSSGSNVRSQTQGRAWGGTATKVFSVDWETWTGEYDLCDCQVRLEWSGTAGWSMGLEQRPGEVKF
jgi:hypothetical protein